MKKFALFIFIVGIAASCSPDQDVDITVNNYYSKKATSVDTIVTFPVIGDTIVEGSNP